MKFTPKTEKQIQDERFPLLKPGKYRFEVFEANDEMSKKGNPMIVLKLKILDNEFGTITYLKDYLMESIAHKLRHAAYVCGLNNSYEQGDLNALSFLGKTGLVDIGVQKDKTGQYPDKNSIQDYLIDEDVSKENKNSAPWEDMPEPPEWVR